MTTIRNEVSTDQENAFEGLSANGRGFVGWSTSGYGVSGDSTNSAGVRGSSVNGKGVEGWTTNGDVGTWGVNLGAGVGTAGDSEAGTGVRGGSKTGTGVYGLSESGRGIEGTSKTNFGIHGQSETFAGIRGDSLKAAGTEGWSTDGAGLLGFSKNGVGIAAEGGRLAGLFKGDVEVTGDIRLTNADCAEDFDIVEAVEAEPGTVMVIDSEGALKPCSEAYDKRVAGVVSGAGNYKPAIVLDKQEGIEGRLPIALIGKAYCKVDAGFEAIEIGDLLTTSSTDGHAMKVVDVSKSIGSIVGKALKPLANGRGMIPILIALQ